MPLRFVNSELCSVFKFNIKINNSSNKESYNSNNNDRIINTMYVNTAKQNKKRK